MKKSVIVFMSVITLAFLMGISSHGVSGSAASKQESGCVSIQHGVLTYSSGHYLYPQSLKPGFDVYGYNYQAHLFNGYYANVYLGGYGYPPYEGDDEAYYERLVDDGFASDVNGAEEEMNKLWYWPYRKDILNMKWNDAWLSNKDCDGDGKLDRHYGYDSYIGSGAWETNHQWGTYIDESGNECQWYYFCKIVAVPDTAYEEDEIWYEEDGTEIGPSIWGQFAIIQEIYNDPCGGEHGVLYKSPAGPGFGKWRPNH